LKKHQLIFMKLIFSIFLICICFLTSLQAKEYSAEFLVKTKGIKIGILSWNIEMSDNAYSTSIELKSEGIFSGLFKFKGSYDAAGKIINKEMLPVEYNQSWATKNKERDVRLVFKNFKINNLTINPAETERPRIDYKNLENYKDPLTSFISILINNTSSLTIDGRRIYLLYVNKDKNHNKILIKEYSNIWADHKRNDLEYLEIYQNEKKLFPKKIIIKFDGSVFSLIKV